jgi:subtilisin family serine protease
MMVLFIATRFQKISSIGGSKNNEMVPNVLVIKFKSGLPVETNKLQTGNVELNDLLAKHAITSLNPVVKYSQITKSKSNIYDLSNIYYVNFSGDQSPAEVAANFETNPAVEYAEPKYIHYISTIPNDSLYFRQQSYYDIIKASQAWDLVKGDESNVIIAIVDGGTDIRHSDLANNIWTNESEVNGIQGIDDDDNG